MSPYQNQGLNKIYDLLFCDNITLYQPEKKPGDGDYPQTILFADQPDTVQLEKIVADAAVESRLKLLACGLLLKKGMEPVKELLGVIIEVGLDNGLDTLAAFNDGTARYINHSESMIVWETQTAASEEIIQRLFAAGQLVVNKIGPWDQPRKQPPAVGMIRLSFLVAGKLYFGEGPFDALAKDAMGGPVITAGIDLMQFLIEHAEKNRSAFQ